MSAKLSAKLTVIFYILICIEVGLLLVVIPWVSFWHDNYFLYYLAARLHWQGLIDIVHSGYFRGAVSGLGMINLLIGFLEIKDFHKTVRAISATEDRPKDAAKQAPSVANNEPTNT